MTNEMRKTRAWGLVLLGLVLVMLMALTLPDGQGWGWVYGLGAGILAANCWIPAKTVLLPKIEGWILRVVGMQAIPLEEPKDEQTLLGREHPPKDNPTAPPLDHDTI